MKDRSKSAAPKSNKPPSLLTAIYQKNSTWGNIITKEWTILCTTQSCIYESCVLALCTYYVASIAI